MKHWIFSLIVIVCALLQATLLNYVRIFNVKPDLLVLSVIFAGITLESRQALSFSILAGILKDAFSINVFGINTVLFPLFSFLIINLSKKISLDNNLIRMACAFAVMLISGIITRVIFTFLGNFISLGIFLRTAFLESLYTALLLPWTFKAMKRLLYHENKYY
jgi:rod shape-determining protein MreD